MIEIKDLTKVYKSRKGETCVALDHISFSLPDKGFVFIVGKSGSGKSTLLNMLGCLDTITSGDIIENGRSLAKLKVSEQSFYRNSTIGFIFQDFLLLDNLTISENVMLSLQLQGVRDKQKVIKSLKDTGLEEFANRYPKELSGGQKQRVAIARALVKNPSILLADEPTGNLDSKTSIQILDLLKQLSKEKLVIIVSHNLNNAHTYADEIIELAEGKILQHVKRNQKFDGRLRVKRGTLIIPSEQTFSDENIEEVAAIIKSGKVKSVKQDKSLFSPSKPEFTTTNSQPTTLEKKHLKFKDTMTLAWKFARRSWLKMTLYSVLVAFLMTLLGLSQIVMNFNGGEVVAKEMAKRNLTCNSFLKNENANYENLDPTRMVDIEEDDIQKFYDAGYKGNIYPLINQSFYFKSSNVKIGVSQEKFAIPTNIYGIGCTAGLLICDEEFLEKKFGELKFWDQVDEPKDYGFYITDFIADICVRSYKNMYYERMLGKATLFSECSYGYVNGIINTGYRERYKDVIATLTDPQMSRDQLKEFAQTEECLAFYDEIYQYLSLSYSFNKSFIDAANSVIAKEFVSTYKSVFTYDNKEYTCDDSYFLSSNIFNNVKLKDNEIIMNYNSYNRTFGKSYSSDNYDEFVPHDVVFSYYLVCDEGHSVKKYETTLKIVQLKESLYTSVADNVFKDLQRAEMFTFGLYFDNDDQINTIINVADQNGFLPNSTIASSITSMAKVVKVFAKFFSLIFIVLCVCILAILVQFSVKNIRDKIKEIGVIKALGGRGIDLMLIFGFQTLIVGLLMVMLFVGLSFLFVYLANDILAVSLVKLAKNSLVLSLSFLSIKWQYLLLDCLLAFGIIILSFIIPMLMLRKIKPTKVIKVDE